MPGPYGVVWRGEDGRGEGGRQPSPFAVGGGYPLTGCIAKSRAGHARPTDCCFRQRGFWEHPNFKSEQRARALSANSNTAFA